MIENIVNRHMKIAAGKPYLERDGLTKSKVLADEAAMLYAIDSGSNKSKYYEMLILVARDGSAKLIRRWGRLGDKFSTKIEQHRDLDSARASMMKIKRSKMTGSSKYIDAFDSRRHKTPDGKQLPKGQYPIGLESNAGPWQNQSILSCKPALRKLVEKINEAVTDAANEDMSAVVEDLQAADALTSELGTSSMAKEIRKKIRGPLNRIQGTGRHSPDPAKAVRELKTLSRYLSKQMSLCMTASVLERIAAPKTASDNLLWSIVDEQAYHKLRRSLGKQNDEATVDMATKVARQLMKKLTLNNNEQGALNRLTQSVKNPNWDIAQHRNNLFKAANLLGIKLPHSMF